MAQKQKKKTGILLESIFSNAQKLGGSYIPDGIILVSHKEKVILWDAKYWLTAPFCNNKEEIAKIRRYIINAKRNSLIKEIGKFKYFWIVGKVDKENFENFVKKVNIKDIKIKFIDFEKLDEIMQLYLNNNEITLGRLNFYEIVKDALLEQDFSKIEILKKKLEQGPSKLIKETKFREQSSFQTNSKN